MLWGIVILAVVLIALAALLGESVLETARIVLQASAGIALLLFILYVFLAGWHAIFFD